MYYNFDHKTDRIDTGAIKWDKLEAVFGDKDLLPLWVADMDFKCSKPIIEAMKETAEHGIFGYTERTDEYFEAVINWMKDVHKANVKKEWILTTPGIVPAINFILQMHMKEGDKVVVQTPVYNPFFDCPKANGIELVYNELKFNEGVFTMDLTDLEAILKRDDVRMFIFCNPHNPVGNVWSESQVRDIAKLCYDNGVLMLSDEIHQDITYDAEHFSALRLEEKYLQNMIIMTAPSKTFNLAGLSVSNVFIPNEELRKAMNNYIDRLGGFGITPFGHNALIAAYNESKDWLDQLLDYLKDTIDMMDRLLEESNTGMKIIKPKGTYLAFIDFRDTNISDELMNDLILTKAKVAINMGYNYGEPGKGFFRINFGSPRDMVEEGLCKIIDAVKEHMLSE